MLTFRWDETKSVEDKPVLDNNAIHPPTLVHNILTEQKTERGQHIFKEKNSDAAIAKCTEAIKVNRVESSIVLMSYY